MKLFLHGGKGVGRRLAGLVRAWCCMVLAVATATGCAAEEIGHGAIPGYTVIRLGRGHYNRLCLAASVEGCRGLMIVDTGAGGILLSNKKYHFLSPSADRKLPPGVPATIPVNGMRSQVGVARDFHLAQLNLGTVPVALVEGRYLYDAAMLYVEDSDRQYDGLLGESVLRHYNAVLDCGRLGLYLNVDPARKHDFGPALIRAGWTRIPMENLSNDFTVPCRIGGRSFRIVVDTGAPFTNLDKDLVSSVHLNGRDIPMQGGVIGTRAKAVAFLELSGFQVGTYSVPTTQTVVADGLRRYVERPQAKAGDPVIGLLGGSFLAANNAIVDVGDHALFLKAGSAGAVVR